MSVLYVSKNDESNMLRIYSDLCKLCPRPKLIPHSLIKSIQCRLGIIRSIIRSLGDGY